jgi:hypothetical protein
MGIEPGATENAAAVKRLLTHLRDQGRNGHFAMLFVPQARTFHGHVAIG